MLVTEKAPPIVGLITPEKLTSLPWQTDWLEGCVSQVNIVANELIEKNIKKAHNVPAIMVFFIKWCLMSL